MLSALSMVSGLSVSAVQRWWFLRAAFAPSCSVSQSLAQSLHLVAVPCAFLTPSESGRAPSVSAAVSGSDRFLRTVSVSGSVAVSVPVGIFIFIGEQATAPRTLPLQARRGCRSSETFPGWHLRPGVEVFGEASAGSQIPLSTKRQLQQTPPSSEKHSQETPPSSNKQSQQTPPSSEKRWQETSSPSREKL